MNVNPIYSEIKKIPSLDEKLDVAAETLNFRINVSYKNSVWKGIANSILTTGKNLLGHLIKKPHCSSVVEDDKSGADDEFVKFMMGFYP